MRSFSTLTVLSAGVALLGACAPAADSAVEAAEAPEMSVTAPQDVPCFLRRGTAEEAAQRPSPLGETAITLGGQTGKICYGRPSARGRTIFGELEAYGTPWRTGANEATALHLPFPSSIGGIEMEAGSYSLYTVPGETEWEVVLNRNVERWGIPIDDALREADVGSFTVPSEATEAPVEQLTFRWEAQGQDTGQLVLEWENTRIRIPIAGSEM